MGAKLAGPNRRLNALERERERESEREREREREGLGFLSPVAKKKVLGCQMEKSAPTTNRRLLPRHCLLMSSCCGAWANCASAVLSAERRGRHSGFRGLGL